jgi:hypothetical protein
MSLVSYKLRIRGLDLPDGQISVHSLVALLAGLQECAERSLRLAIEGASTRPGRAPAWLTQGVDWVVSGIEKGSTILAVDAPQLGGILNQEGHQQDFWNTPLASDDTAFTLLARTLEDTRAEKLESPYYDGGVLKSILSLRSFFRSEDITLELSSTASSKESITIGLLDIQKAEGLGRRTPDPRVFVIAGHLDKIAHKDQAFQLAVADDKRLLGRIDSEFVNAEALRQYWGKKVTVKGLVHFHPSGKVQLVEAQSINPWENGDDVFAETPFPVESPLLNEVTDTIKHSQVNPFEQVRGQWPGEESIEDLLNALRGN